MRQFVADASHELRTPLTAIRGFAEYYRQRGGVANSAEPGRAGPAADDALRRRCRGPPCHPGLEQRQRDRHPAGLPTGPMNSAELDRLIERVEGEAVRMGVLVDDMLLLARLDQQRPLDFRTVDLLAIAADALHDARVIAPQRTINLTVGTPDAPACDGRRGWAAPGGRQPDEQRDDAYARRDADRDHDPVRRAEQRAPPKGGTFCLLAAGGRRAASRVASLLSSSRSPTMAPD